MSDIVERLKNHTPSTCWGCSEWVCWGPQPEWEADACDCDCHLTEGLVREAVSEIERLRLDIHALTHRHAPTYYGYK